jgi:hypothetical protein
MRQVRKLDATVSSSHHWEAEIEEGALKAAN